MCFVPGLPTGGLLGAKHGVRFPLLVSVGLCVVNFLMITLVMPETLPKEKRVKQVGGVGWLLLSSCVVRLVGGAWIFFPLPCGGICSCPLESVRPSLQLSRGPALGNRVRNGGFLFIYLFWRGVCGNLNFSSLLKLPLQKVVDLPRASKIAVC